MSAGRESMVWNHKERLYIRTVFRHAVVSQDVHHRCKDGRVGAQSPYPETTKPLGSLQAASHNFWRPDTFHPSGPAGAKLL